MAKSLLDALIEEVGYVDAALLDEYEARVLSPDCTIPEIDKRLILRDLAVLRSYLVRRNAKSERPAPKDAADPDLWLEARAQVKAELKSVWPSAYASGMVVQRYKDLYREVYGNDKAFTGKKTRGGLTKWFGEKWVDLSKPIYDEDDELAGFEPCGRKHASHQLDSGDYPKCRPLAVAMSMTEEQRESAIRRKRKAEKSAPRKRARKPVFVKTFEE
jgi:hypothetical protein